MSTYIPFSNFFFLFNIMQNVLYTICSFFFQIYEIYKYSPQLNLSIYTVKTLFDTVQYE